LTALQNRIDAAQHVAVIGSPQYFRIGWPNWGVRLSGGLAMTLESVERSQAARPGFSCECAQCGDAIMAPEWSEHVSERCVRHFWSCDACGYEFETSVYLRIREPA
jgi:hypothetical protein